MTQHSAIIQVDSLTFTYPRSKQPALRGLSFEIARGEIFGFLGPNGAGKSTAQKVLIGLLEGFGGSVSVMDRPISAWGPEYYERIGVSFEQPNHFLKLTAHENLRYFAALYSRPTLSPDELLGWVDLQADAHVPVGQFSKGMKSRLNVARALLNDPELLFLDEPTSGLDPVSASRIRDLVVQQKRAGKTIFLTTHNMFVADELCDRVAFIVDGAIRLIDAPRALKLRHGRRLIRVEYRDGQGIERRDWPLDTAGDDPTFLEVLRSGRVETLHTQEATLEDIFIQVTGRSLE